MVVDLPHNNIPSWNQWMLEQIPMNIKEKFMNCTLKQNRSWWLNNGNTELTIEQEYTMNRINQHHLQLSAYNNYLHLQALSRV